MIAATSLASVVNPAWGQWNCAGGTCSTTGAVGIGTSNPGTKLDIAGGTTVQSGLTNASSRPTIGTNTIPGEIRGYSSSGHGYDDGFLRLRAGGDTDAWVASYIDLSGWSLVPDMWGSIVFGTVATERMRITPSGAVGIGISNPLYKLAVNGNIGAQDIIVTNTGWSDYVFRPGYRLRPLSEVRQYIQKNGHLPDIPTEAEVKEKGVSVGDMQTKLLAKVEELTLHMIRADERNDRLERQNQELRERLARLEKAATATSSAAAK